MVNPDSEESKALVFALAQNWSGKSKTFQGSLLHVAC
jgi:hypothetical protein